MAVEDDREDNVEETSIKENEEERNNDELLVENEKNVHINDNQILEEDNANIENEDNQNIVFSNENYVTDTKTINSQEENESAESDLEVIQELDEYFEDAENRIDEIVQDINQSRYNDGEENLSTINEILSEDESSIIIDEVKTPIINKEFEIPPLKITACANSERKVSCLQPFFEGESYKKFNFYC